jgi:hypothetical protein
MAKNVFGDDEQVDKIVFRPLNIDMAAKVKKVSDPAPRPLPRPLDDESKFKEDWVPGLKKQGKPKKHTNIDLSGYGTFIKWVFFSVFSIALMAGLAYLVLWVFQQYNF